jgi:hypothetical protein
MPKLQEQLHTFQKLLHTLHEKLHTLQGLLPTLQGILPNLQGRLQIYGGSCMLKKYAVLTVKPQPRFWLLPCGFGAVAVLFFSNVVNRGLQKMTPRRALGRRHRRRRRIFFIKGKF